MADGSGRREVFAAFGAGAYVLRYRLDAGRQPVVIRVWHTREWRGGSTFLTGGCARVPRTPRTVLDTNLVLSALIFDPGGRGANS